MITVAASILASGIIALFKLNPPVLKCKAINKIRAENKLATENATPRLPIPKLKTFTK